MLWDSENKRDDYVQKVNINTNTCTDLQVKRDVFAHEMAEFPCK